MVENVSIIINGAISLGTYVCAKFRSVLCLETLF